jgi:hypothetical protein
MRGGRDERSAGNRFFGGKRAAPENHDEKVPGLPVWIREYFTVGE